MWRVDLFLRFLYVLVAPVFLVAFAVMIPMTGVLVGVGIATVVALIGSDRWRERTKHIPVFGGFLGKLAMLGDYYREHPPKPLIYYVLYPLLMPYWLFVRSARREFLLYRRLNLIALLAIPSFATLEYFRKWQPEIPLKVFLSQTIAIFVLQLLVTFVLVMPIVTTIVAYHARGKRKTLAVLLLLAALGATLMTIFSMRRDEPDQMTALRMTHRARVDTKLATRRLAAGIAAAHDVYLAAPEDHAAARAAAWAELGQLWQDDEARLFRVHRSPDGTTALYVNMRSKPTIWLARLPDGRLTYDPRVVPADLRAKLKRPRLPPPRPSNAAGPNPPTTQ